MMILLRQDSVALHIVCDILFAVYEITLKHLLDNFVSPLNYFFSIKIGQKLYINESNINVYKWFMISGDFITVDTNTQCYNVNVYELSSTMIVVIVWVIFSWYIHIYVCNSNTMIYVTATGVEPRTT